MRPKPLRLTARPTQRIGLGTPSQAGQHLKTADHRKWAAAVLKRAGYRCEWMENGQRCPIAYPPHRLHADHIQERRDTNSGTWTDLRGGMCLCVSHHVAKTLRERAKRMARRD